MTMTGAILPEIVIKVMYRSISQPMKAAKANMISDSIIACKVLQI